MNRTRAAILCAFSALVLMTLFITGTGAEPGTVKQIVPGVWFREGDLKDLGHCNNVIIEMKDYLIVVDANFPSGAKLAMEAAKKVSSKPVKYVFDTHHHGDHAYGNPVWTQAGATTLAYKGVKEEMDRYEPARWRSTAKEREDVAELKRDGPEYPKQTFDKSPFVLKDGAREVQFHFLGWAHTRGDGFVYLPKEQVLCTGDAAVNGPYNYTADANIGNWPRVLEKAQKFKVAHVLPGHGGAGGPEILAGQRQFMIELHKGAQTAIDKGKKLEEMVRMDGGKPVSASLQLPDTVRNWVGDGFGTQVKDAWEEISQKKAHGDIPH